MMTKYELKRTLLDVFFPNRCPVCNKVIGRMDYICKECGEEFEYSYTAQKFCTGRLLCVCRYDDKSSRIVLGAKRNRDGSKLSFMAYTLMQCITQYYDTLPDILVPVPMYRSDKRRKGYCHTEKICAELSELTGIPVVKAVVKVKRTKEQKSLTRKERLDNLNSSFALSDAESLRGKHILVVDDVSTTGATLEEVFRTLMQSDFEAVDFAVFAKTTDKNDNKEENA